MFYEMFLEFQCEGDYVAPRKYEFNHSHGNYLPGDAAEVANFKVMRNGTDITSCFSVDEIKALKNEFIAQYEDESDDGDAA